ncbi:carboxysome shell carbonic anhydrase domain-containg protein [Nitrosomonas communis]|uniref:Carboxysome Shell Carbonic Anhydrase n=1 Tax=Nitrosomonas communis TaxID=44574 RepID=A0A1H2Z2Z7_9PROT|nr:carboxysome shell carbonic anhydrase domain-containg protein [Nitrosomonas communis]SDX11790.1 Carboxysome Shell Carbonic Anhydrase [Nitrosomonas communis]
MNNQSNAIDYLLDLNARHAQAFMDLASERRRYRGEHPTEIAALKCMDGRLHLPVITQTALGIIQPFRNLGGNFGLGWPFFQVIINEWVQYSISRGRHCLVFVTYHYARGDTHRGCRGFNYDTDIGRAAATKLKDQFIRVYGKGAVVPIVCGIETDLDALVLHGEDDRSVVDLAKIRQTSQIELEEMLYSLYPSMSERIVRDLIPLVRGNIRHIAEIRASNRPIEEAEHKEWVIGVGRGFDWLHLINTAFIVGPFDPNLSVTIETAAKLLKGNIDEGRVDPKGIVLMTSAAFRDKGGPEYHLAREKAIFLSKLSFDIIKEKVPDLVPHLQILTGATDLDTRKIEVIERLDSEQSKQIKSA